MKFVSPLLAAVLAVTLAGCGKPDVKTLLRESRELSQKGDRASWEQVRENLHEVINSGHIDPDTEGADRLHSFYVLSLIRTERPEEALKAAKRAVSRYPEAFMSNYLLGKVYFDQGRMAAATPHLEKAWERRPNDRNTIVLLTTAAGRSNYRRAGEFFAHAASMPQFANDARLYNEWGMWLLAQGETARAIRKFNDSCQMDNADAGTYMNLAVVYDKHLNRPKLARNFYKRFLVAVGQTSPGGRLEARRKTQERLRELR